MKIIKEDICYLEVKDIQYIGEFPKTISNCFGECIKGEVTEFAVIKDPRAIDYIRKLSSIIDYNYICNYSEQTLKNEIKIIVGYQKVEVDRWMNSSPLLKNGLERNVNYWKKKNDLEYQRKTLTNYLMNKEKYDQDVLNLYNITYGEHRAK